MLAIIVPCYNEALRMACDEFVAFSEQHPDIHFYFANDGSSDATAATIQQKLANGSTRFLVDYKINRGKAETVRNTLYDVYSQNRDAYSHYGFIDADLAIPLEQILKLKDAHAAYPGKYMFFTVRTEKDFSQLGRLRYYISKIWKFFFVRLFFGLTISDSQCGCKLFDRNIIEQAFQKQFISRWLFDIEIVFRVFKTKTNALQEVPIIRLNDNSGSTINNLTILKLLKDAIKIYATYKLRKA